VVGEFRSACSKVLDDTAISHSTPVLNPRAFFYCPSVPSPKSCEHVDILGNVNVITDFLRIVTEFELDVVNENRILSDIEAIAEEINADGGIHRQKGWL